MSHFRIFLLFFILLPGLSFGQTYTKRLALVIGNSEYQNGGSLKNPVNDARSMAVALKDLGFEVMKYENISQTQMKQAINAYGVRLKEYEVGLFYYAGHGIQHKGTNYMIPVEADLQAAEQIEFDCVAADRVLAYMEAAATKVNIIVMDACRNNPFERSWHRAVNGNGLAMMNAPTGSLIAYATAPGRVASDGEAQNGLYTNALLKYMKDPGLNIEQIFKRVRTEVSEKSFGAQIPWETTSLTGNDFYFKNAAVTEPGKTVQTVSESDPAVGFYSKATDKYDEKKFDEAVVEYSKAIEVNPMYVEAYLWRGHSYYGQQKYKEAIVDYNKTLELSPGESQAYYYRGLSKYQMKLNAEAVADFSLSVRYDPTYANGYYWRGYCYYVQEKYYAAIEDYSKTISLSPDYVEVYYFRGLAYYNVKDYEKCYADFLKAAPEGNVYLDAVYWQGNSSFMLKEYKRAISEYSAYISKNPTVAEAFYWRGYSYYYLSDMTRALADVDKALALSPNNETYLAFRRDYLKK